MKKRFAGYGLLLITVFAGAGFAWGGWAVVTIDTLPQYMTAGVATPISFVVRQHGVEARNDLSAAVRLVSGKEQIIIPAIRGKRGGQYVAMVAPPHAGQWTVQLKSGFNGVETTLLPIHTIAAGEKAPAAQPIAEHGRRLFVAKGCAQCHQHGRTPPPMMKDFGPDLTKPRLMPEYMKEYIADPSIRPATDAYKRMPNLDLNKAEIEAIVAFLSAPVTAAAATH